MAMVAKVAEMYRHEKMINLKRTPDNAPRGYSAQSDFEAQCVKACEHFSVHLKSSNTVFWRDYPGSLWKWKLFT